MDPIQSTEKADISKQCFTPIQSRTMYVAASNNNNNNAVSSSSCNRPMALCPSMDLMVFLSSQMNTILLHRTVSWQRLAARVVTATPSLSAAAATNVDAASTGVEKEPSVQQVCWSPDGRSLAIATSNQILALYHVETIGDAETPPLSQVALADGNKEVSQDSSILAMSWAHVGKPHPNWRITNVEHLRQVTWEYQSQYYLDRASRFLPPAYHGIQPDDYAHNHHHYVVEDGLYDDEMDEALQYQQLSPSCRTPLSLLSVAASNGSVGLYLHGRYPIATLTCETLEENSAVTKLCCSSDLTYLLFQRGSSSSSSHVTCFALPALQHHRYGLQVTTALYGSMTWQVNAIKRHLHETLACWKSSLKPLDVKLEALQKVMTNYGVTEDLSTVLLHYIRFGQPTDSTTTSKSSTNSALDQFFTSVQMNDQLVQRVEKSLHAALGNVEGTCRKGLVRPARALVYDALQLVGLWDDARQGDNSRTSSTLQLQQSVQSLYRTAELLLSMLVQARVRLHEFVAWLRSVSAQIKHRSLSHDTHKQRRVPQTTIQHVTEYLTMSASQQGSKGTSSSLTERLLGLDVSHLCSAVDSQKKRPTSPRAVHHDAGCDNKSLPELLLSTEEDMAIAFAEPRAYVSQSLSQQDWVIPNEDADVPMDIHTRVGCGSRAVGSDTARDTTEGCYRPCLITGSMAEGGPDLSCCRNWALIAKASSWKGQHDSVCLYAVPLGWNETAMSNDDDLLDGEDGLDEHCAQGEIKTPYYLFSRLVLTPDNHIRHIAFYGDDGKSSLSSGIDSGTGKEGRQAIGLLARRNDIDELWVVPYESVAFQVLAAPDVNLDEKLVLQEGDATTSVPVMPLQDGEIATDEASLVFARTRRVASAGSGDWKLLVSGSRGVGAVCNSLQTHVALNLFDLEEDEESDEDDDDT